jgi:secreted Zn-dependent insulinase-like peptidase
VFLFQILVRTVPIKEGHKLRIIWPITPEIHHYKEGPCRYLGHLIGHEGEGSLFYILKALGGFCLSIFHTINFQEISSFLHAQKFNFFFFFCS